MFFQNLHESIYNGVSFFSKVGRLLSVSANWLVKNITNADIFCYRRTARYWKRELDSRKFINPIETRFFNVSLLNFDEKAKIKLKQK